MKSILIPEYLAGFKCIGSACEDTCCAGWDVAVDKRTYQAYRKIQHPHMTEKLQQNVKRNHKQYNDVNYAKFILDQDKKCSMLLEDGLCSIHKELGEAYLCNTCANYPRVFTQVGDVVEKSLTLSCPEAARLVLLREEGLGFIETEEAKEIRGTFSNKLVLERNPYFWDIRVFIIQLMQSRQQSIEIRLIILGLFLQKVEQVTPYELERELPAIIQDYLKRLDNEEFVSSLQNIKGNLSFQFNLVRKLIQYRMSGGGVTEKYLKIFNQILEGLNLEEDEKRKVQDIEKSMLKYQEAYSNFYEPFIQKQEYMLENYIVNYIFKNLFPCDYSTFFESYRMLIVHFTLIKLHVIGISAKQQRLTEEMVIECIQQLVKVIEHHSAYLQGVREGMENSGYTTMGHMFVMIKN
ncbi:flagellin lysine-N-methylase [Metasolibacillus meyeri]|uniref:flagellin lysine-N-methylase n=1 Tax=Metasolibacillus meyeri TaxID=1071052 RepID=UPI000D30903D|nr:flagellin lysine-N-methylase [Metasolibacillus meyeri]